MPNEIGKSLNRIKKEMKLTREEMAQILEIDIKSLDRYISGDRDPNTSKVKKMADNLNVTVCDLFGNKCPRCIEKE